MDIQGYAVHSKGGRLAQGAFQAGPLGANDVVVKISHCGLCHSDIDLIDDALGMGGFPLVPGHEIVGVVETCGDAVTSISVGDRVGIGPIRSSCGQCHDCRSARDHYCSHKTLTASPGGLGGFADRIIVPGASAVKIPDALPSAEAAPLLCAGLTTFSALCRLGSPGENVAVLGVGGLGHLAVQFACNMGMRVTTLSAGLNDEEVSRHHSLGADECFDVSSEPNLNALKGTFDFIISTVYGDVDWFSYVSLLRPEGRLCIVGASLAPLAFPAGMLIPGARTIAGSAAGSSKDMHDMLNFAAQFHVRPKIEVAPMSRINEAVARVKEGSVRYRMVLES